MLNSSVFNLGNCQIIPIEYAIKSKGEEKQSIQPKFIEVLCYLASHYPRVIPREELIENVWAGNAYVGEKALTNAIWHLRQHLKGSNGEQEVIETIRKVGYRLLVEPCFEQQQPDTNSAEISQANNTIKARYLVPQPVLLGVIISLCFLTLYFVFFNNQPMPEPKIQQITRNPGTELFNAPSPDGRYVVFKWINKQGRGNLYVKDRQNEDMPPKQLTFGSNYLGHSVWSTDGRFLYFSRRNISKNTCEIIRLKVKSQQETKVADCPVLAGYLYIDISPDNRYLGYQGIEPTDQTTGIYLLDLQNPTDNPLRFSCLHDCDYRERDFIFSPDGKTLAVTRRYNRFDENIYLVDIESKATTQVTFDEADIVGLTWHPDGSKIVYGVQRSDKRQGYVLDITTGKSTSLQMPGFSYPAFAFNTGELFYQQRREKYSIARLAFDTDIASLPFPVLKSQFNHHYPHYSEQAGKIVYVSNESGHYELWLTDVEGQNRQQITFLNQTVRYPRWSQNGEKIAFLAPSDSEKADKIFIYDVKTKALTPLPSKHRTHNRPTWSWDDKAIISAMYEKEYVDLHAIDIESGNSKRLTQDGGRFGVMTSPSTLLYTTADDGLWQTEVSLSDQNTVDHGKPLEKISGEDFKTTYAWEFTNKGIFYRQDMGEYQLLSFYDFGEQKSTPLIKLPRNTLAYASSLSFIERSNSLLFTQADMPQSDIKKVEHPLVHR